MSEESASASPESNEQAFEAAANQAKAESAQPTDESQLAAELEAAKAKAEENWNTALRTQAEMENLRKRQAREMDQARKFAIERFLGDVLPIRDSLEMGLQAAANASDMTQLKEGTALTLKMFDQVFERNNVVLIDPVGEKFNPDMHEAMSMQPSEEHAANIVMACVQKGYQLNDRVVRPAMVVVSSGPAGGGASSVNETA